MTEEELRAILGDDNYNKLSPEEVDFMLNTAGEFDGIQCKTEVRKWYRKMVEKGNKYMSDREPAYADVFIWFYDKVQPQEYNCVFPYHEFNFYCVEDHENNTVYKFAHNTIYQIKEVWSEQR